MEVPPDLGRIVFKRWQALVFCQTAIDTALELYPAFRKLDAASVSQVDVWAYHMHNPARTFSQQDRKEIATLAAESHFRCVTGLFLVSLG